DQGQAPVRKQQPQALKQHDECPDREDERRKDPARPAQLEDGNLDRVLVALPNRPDQGTPLSPQNFATRPSRVIRGERLRSRHRRLRRTGVALHHPIVTTGLPQRSDLKAALSSSENSCGSSHAAKCPPRSTLL